MTSRLVTLSAELAVALAAVDAATRTRSAVAACVAASELVFCTALQRRVLIAMQSTKGVLRQDAFALQQETEALDAAYFAADGVAEGSGVAQFFLARMGMALGFAIQADESADAAAEAVYEAAMASDTLEVALSAARAALPRCPV